MQSMKHTNVSGTRQDVYMNILTDVRSRVERLASWDELDVEAADLPVHAAQLSDASVVAVMEDLAGLANDVGRMQAVLAGVAASRSARDRGQAGLAAVQGFASPESLIQSITGGSKADAAQQVRVGRSLLEGTGAAPGLVGANLVPVPGAGDGGDGAAGGDGAGGGGADGAPVSGARPEETGSGGAADDSAVRDIPWHEPLRRALLNGDLTTSQHDAIRRGLGDPRVATVKVSGVGGSVSGAEPHPMLDTAPDADATERDASAREAMVREAWMVAAASLAAEAPTMPPEELKKRARTVRDILDPIGAEERYLRRFDSRAFRVWTDADGQEHGSFVFDDEFGAFVRSMMVSALRPRRGGPRFMTDEERAAAQELIADTRTNDQLAYDLMVDVIRAGALANAKDVFGSRQPGVRMVVVKDAGPRDAFGRMLATGHDQDGGCSFPGSVIDRNACANGFIEVIVDPQGNPLDLGREARLYSSTQRLVLAVRDGGCLWPGCDRPASYCEAHHCDNYANGGRTDVDRGVLLCRFHHMKLHNQGWRIARDGKGPFVLHRPSGEGAPVVLVSKAAWKWAWDPPPPPDRVGWRSPPDLPPRREAAA